MRALFRNLVLLVCIIAASLAANVASATIVIQPDEASSKDTFVYQFLSGFNFDTTNQAGFGLFLPVGATTTGHDTRSFLQFTLPAINPALLQSATLQLFQGDTTTTGFGVNPSGGQPQTVNLLAVTNGWSETTASFAAQPTTGAQYASQVITSFNQTVSFNVKQLVLDWANGVIPNNGLALIAAAPVGSSPNWVYSTFLSSAQNPAPALILTPVPEPTTMALALCAAPLAGWGLRRAWKRRRASVR